MQPADLVILRPRCPARGVRAAVVLQARRDTDPGQQASLHRLGTFVRILFLFPPRSAATRTGHAVVVGSSGWNRVPSTRELRCRRDRLS